MMQVDDSVNSLNVPIMLLQLLGKLSMLNFIFFLNVNNMTICAMFCCPEFDQLNNQNNFCYMLTRPSVARIVGQFIIDAFDERPVKI